MLQVPEGKGGVPAPNGARIECWEQPPSTVPRLREAEDGAPTVRSKKGGGTLGSLFPSVSYANSKIGTQMATGQRTANG